MKKLGKILLIAAACAVLALAVVAALPRIGMFVAVATNYTDIEESNDGFAYLTRGNRKKVGVCDYAYDSASGSQTIDIPETYKGRPVKGLGGYIGKGAPCPFNISLKGVSSTALVGLSEDESFDWYMKDGDKEVVYCDVVLNIGANIREIYADQCGIEAGNKLYVVRVYVNCAADNPAFYAKDGILYEKNGKVVDGFLYWDRDYADPSA